MKIFLDDARDLAAMGYGGMKFTICRKAKEAIALIVDNPNKIKFISFDHDLGGRLNGYDVAKMVEGMAAMGKITKPINYRVHSANPVGAQRIEAAMQKAFEYWDAKNNELAYLD